MLPRYNQMEFLLEIPPTTSSHIPYRDYNPVYALAVYQQASFPPFVEVFEKRNANKIDKLKSIDSSGIVNPQSGIDPTESTLVVGCHFSPGNLFSRILNHSPLFFRGYSRTRPRSIVLTRQICYTPLLRDSVACYIIDIHHCDSTVILQYNCPHIEYPRLT